MLKSGHQASWHRLLLVASCLLLRSTASIAGDRLGQADLVLSAEQAAQDAVEFLEEKGMGWVEKQKCVSCHQVPAMVWSLSSVRASGLELKEVQLEEQLNWSTEYRHFQAPEDRESAVKAEVLTANIDTMAALLNGVPPGSTTSENWRVEFLTKLVEEQNDDGSWTPRGQLPLQKRELLETQQATTLWVLLALLRHEMEGFDRESALKFVELDNSSNEVPKAKSVELWTTRMLVANELGWSERVSQFARGLAEYQNEDGGWAWLLDEESDALATGQVLYVLKVTDSGDQEWKDHASNFLIDSQLPAGFWKVPGTKKASKGRATATANYWGTAWAVIGLLEDSAG